MTSIRGTNSTVQASPISKILNTTLNAIAVINNSSYNSNMTTDELTISLGDPSVNYTPEISIIELKNYATYIIPCILIVILIVGIINHIQIEIIKNKLHIPSLINWAKNMYGDYTAKEILPRYRKKAKESPFIGSQPTPLVLPACSRLDNVEKGHNLNFQFSIPYRRFQSTDNLLANEEHRITITTVVQKSPKLTTN